MCRKIECHVKAEIRLINLHTKNTKDCQQTTRREVGTHTLSCPQKETLSVTFSHPGCSSLLQQP